MKEYIKDNLVVLEDNCNRFVYEVFLFVKFDNIYSMVAHKYFSADIEIKGVIEQLKLSKYLTYECQLYSAPIKWLEENDFIPYEI